MKTYTRSVLVLLFLCGSALAGEISLTWSNPDRQVTEVDAGPLTNLAGTRVWELVGEVDETQTSVVLPAKPPGEYTYVATSFTADGTQSRISNMATKTVVTFQALAGSTAYQVVTISTGFWMIPMATMTTDTECDATQSANGMYRVPTAAVTWNPGTTARPVMLVAVCE
jgi:hypothetical protein